MNTPPKTRLADRPRSRRIRGIAASLTATATVALAVLLILLAPSVAWAQTVDPLPVARLSVDGVLGILTTYGPVVGGMYLAYAVASTLVARYQADSWLAQGKRLAWVTGTLGVAGAALQAQIAGSPWTVIAAAAMAMAFKLLTPTVTPAATTPAATTTASPPPTPPATPTIARPGAPTASSIGTVAKTALIALVISCGGASAVDRGATGLAAGISCEDPSVVSFVTQAVPILVKAILTMIRGDGTIDRAALTAAAKPMQDTALQCAMDAAVAAATTTPAPATTTSSTATSASAKNPATSETNRQTWTEIRAELGWTIPATGSAPRPTSKPASK